MPIKSIIKKHPIIIFLLFTLLFLFTQCKYDRYIGSEPYRPLIDKYFKNKITPASVVIKDFFPDVDQEKFSIICVDRALPDDHIMWMNGYSTKLEKQHDEHFPYGEKYFNIQFDFTDKYSWYSPFYIFVTTPSQDIFHVSSINWQPLLKNSASYPAHSIVEYDRTTSHLDIQSIENKNGLKCHPIKDVSLIAIHSGTTKQEFGFIFMKEGE